MKTGFSGSDKIFGVEIELIIVWLLPLAVTVAGILWILLVVVPKFGQMASLNAKYDQLKKSEKTFLSQRSYYLAIDEEELSKNSEIVSRALLQENNAYYLVMVIRKIASKYDFTVQSFSVSIEEMGDEKVKSTTFATVPVSLTLVGSNNRTMELVKALERSLPLLSLGKFEQKNTSSGLTELSLVVSSYYLRGKGELDVSKLSVDQLTLKKEEMEVLATLADYDLVESFEGMIFGDLQKKEYFKVERQNPFNY